MSVPISPTKLDDRQNHLRDVARPGRPARVCSCASIAGRQGWSHFLESNPWSVIQQPVPHGPDHDLLLRAETQLYLNGVDGVSDGNRLDSPFLRNRGV